tara:strand:- start:2140 stop:2403 length:264 start_codon:yes stop_codon:yes gene_type:complete
MRTRQIDGLILATTWRDDPLVTERMNNCLPIVLIDRTAKTDGVSSVANDDVLEISLALRHLTERGHKRIPHIAGPCALSTGEAGRAD